MRRCSDLNRCDTKRYDFTGARAKSKRENGSDSHAACERCEPVQNAHKTSSRAGYEYHLKEGSQYELCAVFSAASKGVNAMSGPNTWAHPMGLYCFPLDAVRPAESPNLYLPY